MDDFERFKTLAKEETADVTEIAGEIEVSHDKTLMDEELLHMEKPRKWIPEMES